MPTGVDQLKHFVVLMMENRSFDHLLGYLKKEDPRIDGVDGSESNPDPNGEPAHVKPDAKYQGQLQPDPGHHFEDVKLQIHGDKPGDPKMSGFVKSFYQKQKNVGHARQIMYCFTPDKMPVITTLARKFCVFNKWFSSLPGPTIPNRAFAHYGTSFGRVDMNLFYVGVKYPSIYERMEKNGRTAKIYYYDLPSGTMGMTSILKDQPHLFGTVNQFLNDCQRGTLPDYSFIEPNYTDHGGSNGELLACDQHPDHNMQAGEEFIAQIYMALRNSSSWNNTALLLVYDEHGGIYDHVEPPSCTPDEFTNADTGFKFDSLGVRVPAVLISPWVKEGTVVSDRVFDHASIPASVTRQFIGAWHERSPREEHADTFLDLLTLPAPRTDYVGFSTSSNEESLADGRTMAIPEAPAEASQPERGLSDLLRDHVNAVHKVEMELAPEDRTNIDVSTIATEGEASMYIAQVMARLHPQVATAGQI